MSDKFNISLEGEITVIEFLAETSYNEVKTMLDDVSENYPYEKRLFDMSNIKFNFSEREIKDIAEYGKKVFIKPNILAIFTKDDLAFGEMRQFMVYREEDGHAAAFVFKDKEEAMEWLLENS